MTIKTWCLHCETVVAAKDDKECLNCGAGAMDVESLKQKQGFFYQAYPEMQYEEIEVGKYYPLYPKELKK